MERFSWRSQSGSCLDRKNDSFHDGILRKFKFVKSLKNYMFSKIRSTKYDLCNCTPQEVSIISYDQRSFTDVEKEFDLQGGKSVTIDTEALENLKKALNQSLRNKNLKSNKHLELLEIAEKTFARQLDIFEGILKLIHVKNNESYDLENMHKQFISGCVQDEPLDSFAGTIVTNLINELTKEISAVGQPLVEESSQADTEESFEDCYQTKRADISCQCPQPPPNGAAVPEFKH